MKLHYLAVLCMGLACVANAGETGKKDTYAENVYASFERNLEPLKASDVADNSILHLATLDTKLSDEQVLCGHQLIMR